MKASEYFKQDYGRRFTGATLYGKGGILELSMKDIYDLMESYHQAKVNAVTDKEIDDQSIRDYPIKLCFYGTRQLDDNYNDRLNYKKGLIAFKEQLLK